MKSGLRTCLAILAVVLSFAAFAQEPVPVDRPEELGFASGRLDRLTKSFHGYVDNNQLPGAVVLMGPRSGSRTR